MKKLLSLALTLAAATAIPASALAIQADDGCNEFQVLILTARDFEEDAGVWYLELDSDSRATCDYSVEWVSPVYGLISTDCVLQELKVHGRKSCIRNSFRNFNTLVDLEPDCDCQGFSELGLLEDIDALVLTENRRGMSGIIKLTGPTGTVHGIEVLDT